MYVKSFNEFIKLRMQLGMRERDKNPTKKHDHQTSN